ncbi:MAG TPA: tRNA glutamyl-Q(34) synthetase GluQRS [Phycisphaerae bacterium]|nr:tRNA glutamyl-Q(34) synthetase GluQRS [Phycisphaerae bacterium]
MTRQFTTRLAPSPTGALHLGNARTFLANWLLAKQRSWRVLFRMEDLDTPRTKSWAADAAITELKWLGLDWGGDVITQSQRSEAYEAALKNLADRGSAYPCNCSRRDVETSASAPAAEDRLGQQAAVYPGTCRNKNIDPAGAAWRVKVDDAVIEFDDNFAGPQSFNLSQTSGDFVIFRKTHQAAYQLAVVVDDAESGVDAIVRGDDLLESAAMQMYLRRLLGYDERMEYWHLPLVLGPDSRKLAKRHGDTRLCHYVSLGVTRQRMLGLLGYWLGTLENRRETDISELAEKFDINKISAKPVIFGRDDHDFLVGRR